MSIDLERAQRETIRWVILACLNNARPIGAAEILILATLRAVPLPATDNVLRRELEYLESGGLVEIDGRGGPQWHAKLTHAGVDVAEYTAPCPPGIARPAKYW